jgi:hypothetical protein
MPNTSWVGFSPSAAKNAIKQFKTDRLKNMMTRKNSKNISKIDQRIQCGVFQNEEVMDYLKNNLQGNQTVTKAVTDLKEFCRLRDEGKTRVSGDKLTMAYLMIAKGIQANEAAKITAAAAEAKKATNAAASAAASAAAAARRQAENAARLQAEATTKQEQNAANAAKREAEAASAAANAAKREAEAANAARKANNERATAAAAAAAAFTNRNTTVANIKSKFNALNGAIRNLKVNIGKLTNAKVAARKTRKNRK